MLKRCTKIVSVRSFNWKNKEDLEENQILSCPFQNSSCHAEIQHRDGLAMTLELNVETLKLQ